MTLAEVMVSITGLEFSYSQAPDSMKSLCQSAWLLTTALGNFLVLFLNAINPIGRLNLEHADMWNTFMYTGIFSLAIVAFGLLALRYRYVGSWAHLEGSSHIYTAVPVVDPEVAQDESPTPNTREGLD